MMLTRQTLAAPASQLNSDLHGHTRQNKELACFGQYAFSMQHHLLGHVSHDKFYACEIVDNNKGAVTVNL